MIQHVQLLAGILKEEAVPDCVMADVVQGFHAVGVVNGEAALVVVVERVSLDDGIRQVERVVEVQRVAGQDVTLTHGRELGAVHLGVRGLGDHDVAAVRLLVVRGVKRLAPEQDVAGQRCDLSEHAVGTPVCVLQRQRKRDRLAIRRYGLNNVLL